MSEASVCISEAKQKLLDLYNQVKKGTDCTLGLSLPYSQDIYYRSNSDTVHRRCLRAVVEERRQFDSQSLTRRHQAFFQRNRTMTITQKSHTVTITFPPEEQVQVITVAEHDLLVSHTSMNTVIEFIRAQYALPWDKAEAIVSAVRATPPAITRLPGHKVEVRYPGAEYSIDVTYAEYSLIPSLSTIQGAKFLRDQYSLGLYEAERCCDAIRAAHTQIR